MSDSEDPARYLSIIKSHEPWTLPTRLEMMGHRGAFSESTGVHLGFQGHGGMEAAAWRKGSEGSERGHDGTSGIAKIFCGVTGRAASGVCIF